MRKQRMFLAGVAALTMLAAIGFGLAYLFRDPINPSACANIQVGMTKAEVTQKLGRPCDGVVPSPYGNCEAWYGPAGSISVSYSDNGLVQSVCFNESQETVYRKLRRMVGLEEDEVTFPSLHYTRHPPQYFPPSPAYPLQKELTDFEKAQVEAELERFWSKP